jgi:hypothetical protein
MRDATGVSMRTGCRWSYGAGIVEEAWYGGRIRLRDGREAGQACRQECAERRRWKRDGGASAQGIGALALTRRGGAGSAPRRARLGCACASASTLCRSTERWMSRGGTAQKMVAVGRDAMDAAWAMENTRDTRCTHDCTEVRTYRQGNRAGGSTL